jgi:ankyrin repeat protein
MKYIKLFEDFEPHDPYELMMIPPNKKAEMIVGEIIKDEPNLNLVSDLIVLGANVDWQNEYGYTPLHWAAERNNLQIARMLIDARADLNVQLYNGSTALHLATNRNNPEIARMLIDAGADLDIQDKWYGTALHEAVLCHRLEIAQMLIDAGARKDIEDQDGKLPYDLARTEEMRNLLKP